MPTQTNLTKNGITVVTCTENHECGRELKLSFIWHGDIERSQFADACKAQLNSMVFLTKLPERTLERDYGHVIAAKPAPPLPPPPEAPTSAGEPAALPSPPSAKPSRLGGLRTSPRSEPSR